MKHIRNWYQLLEGSGLAASDSGPGQAAGTLSADVTWCPFYHPPGTIYDYKGVVIGPSQSRIVSAAAAGFNWTEGSIEMLVKPTWVYSDASTRLFWDTAGGVNKQFRLIKLPTTNTALVTNSIVRGQFIYPWAPGTVYHVVLNWGTNQLYINGVLAYTFTAGNLGGGASTLYIGDRASTPDISFYGTIYYFIARDVPLTPAEIATFKAMFLKQYIPD